MLKKLTTLGILFISLSYAKNAIALSDVFHECQTCNSSIDANTAARGYAEKEQVRNTYIMNLRSGKIWAFQVSKPLTGYITIPGNGEPDGNGGTVPDRTVPQYKVYVSNIDIPSNVQANFDELVVANNDLIRALNDLAEVPKDIASSAWDLVGQGYKQNDISDYYNNNSTIGTQIVHKIGLMGKFSGHIHFNTISMEVTFSDQSVADFDLARVLNDGTYVWSFQGGKDAGGNIIKGSSSSFQSGGYRFTNVSGLNSFVDAGFRNGVKIVNGSRKTFSDGPLIMTCVVESIGRFTCTYTF